MSDLEVSRALPPFSSTTRSHDAIEASRRNRRGGVVWTGRPNSGRRPAGGAGLPHSDDRCIFTRLPRSGGPGFYVALCESGGVHAKVVADDAAAAFSRAFRESDAPIVACDVGLPELASLARAKGLTLAPLSDSQLETRALLALLPEIAHGLSESAVQKADLMRFMNACADLAVLEPWAEPAARHLFEVTATGRGEATRHVLVVQQEGELYGPGLGLLEPDIALQPGSGNVLQVHGTWGLVVQLADVPAFVRPALMEAFGIARFPLAGSLRRCREHGQLLLAEMRLLTGVLECIPQLLNAQRGSSIVDGRTVTIKPHRDDALFGPPAGRA